MPSLLGIDNGLTVTKAALFDIDGTELAVARRRVPQSIPRPRHVERDMDGLWRATAQAIAQALALSGRPASDILGVAATAHGDGLYLLDGDRRPLGPGILSLDSRAGPIVEAFDTSGVSQAALSLTGQVPHASAPSTLLAWIAANEPERFSRIAHVLACKDWLRFCLTGTLGTDRTEASTSFTDVATQGYSRDALDLYGLGTLFGALAPIAHSAEIVGAVTSQAAAATGLQAGTPVAAGLHDVTASALGIGGHREGVAAIVAGTYSINETVSAKPRTDARWFCRNAVAPGRWNAMAISPASTANYDWFLDTLCAGEQAAALAAGRSIHDLLGREIDAALARPSTLLFHPYLFGSPHGPAASASFLGLHGWHDRGDMLRAVLEGIAFNHRVHVDALADGFAFDEIRLTGGGSRNPAFAQMFADVLGRPVGVAAVDEAAAWGAARCAAVGVGAQGSLDDGDERPVATYRPDAARSEAYGRRFALHSRIAQVLTAHWPEIEALAGEEILSR